MKSRVHAKTQVYMYAVTLFIVTQTWKQPYVLQLTGR